MFCLSSAATFASVFAPFKEACLELLPSRVAESSELSLLCCNFSTSVSKRLLKVRSHQGHFEGHQPPKSKSDHNTTPKVV